MNFDIIYIKMSKINLDNAIFKLVGIIGTGQMAGGLCELLARNNIPVVLMGRNENSISKCKLN